ncbi:hypothetical protein [Desulfosarcina ovata]|uniref:Bacteriophage tail tape measure C-terminal domain-containing protein n=1 Tax=Desulfosarcina ovata subsp. ovata TaxID=2752305 RepID=A0A5K8AHL6_9BACT|nr:hypothetical protein [Desulfosarcina ovata]BBO92048.1 hypothetical protein DSCOOX_52280 [Desulfosarcina ovata subsp. ovata]
MSDRKLEIVLSAKDATNKAFNSVSTQITSLAKKAFSLQSAFLALAGTAGMGAMVKQSLEINDALAKTADRLGLTTEALAGLRHAAELSGAGADTLDMALQRMTRRIAEAAQGTGEAKGALEELGLSAEALARMSPDQAMEAIADAMVNVKDQSDRVRLAFKLFDSEGVKLINTLAGGSQSLKDAAQEAKDLGIAINRVDAAAIEEANDAAYRARQALQGLANTVTVALAPGMKDASDAFTDFVKTNRQLIAVKVDQYMDNIRSALDKIWTLVSYDPAILEWGIVGLAFGGKKGAVMLGGMAHMVTWAGNLTQALENAQKGLVEYSEIATANFQELEALANRSTTYTGKINSSTPGYSSYKKEHSPETTSTPSVTASAKLFENDSDISSFFQDLDSASNRAYDSLAYTISEIDAELSTFFHDIDRIPEVDESLTKFFEDIDEAAKNTSVDMSLSDYFGDLDITEEELRKKFDVFTNLSERTAWAMQENFSSVFSDAFTGQLDSLEDYATSFCDSILKMFADLAAQALTKQLFGSAAGGTGSGWVGAAATMVASLFHGGGMVGTDGGTRSVNPALFVGAPRYHKGLAPDEYPAILQKGEAVLTPAQLQAVASMGTQQQAQPQVIQMTNITDPRLIDQYLASSQGQKTVLNIVGSNAHTIRRVLR